MLSSVSQKGDKMKKPRQWGLVLVVLLMAGSAWAAGDEGRQTQTAQPVFVATINGLVFEMTSARDVAALVLERGLSLSDMVNGVGFAGASLDEIIGGALDYGAAPETIAQVMIDSGYRSDQVVLAALASGAPTPVVDRFSAQVGVTPERAGTVPPLVHAATATKVPAEFAEEDCAREVRPEFDRAMTEAAGRGETTEDVVRSLLERGLDLCGVVKSAIESGGDLNEIFAGARAAGYSREMVAREATLAGSAEAEVLLALRSTELLGLGYTPGTERAAGFSSLTPIQGSVGGNVRGRFASPFQFQAGGR